jgi:hypothetical protein
MRYSELAAKDMLPHEFWYGITITCSSMLSGAFVNIEEYNSFYLIQPIMSDFEHEIFAKCPDKPLTKGLIIGAETGGGLENKVPEREWVFNAIKELGRCNVPVYMKSTLREIVGEENMRRELAWGRNG